MGFDSFNRTAAALHCSVSLCWILSPSTFKIIIVPNQAALLQLQFLFFLPRNQRLGKSVLCTGGKGTFTLLVLAQNETNDCLLAAF